VQQPRGQGVWKEIKGWETCEWVVRVVIGGGRVGAGATGGGGGGRHMQRMLGPRNGAMRGGVGSGLNLRHGLWGSHCALERETITTE
jgi:hypothetical protein